MGHAGRIDFSLSGWSRSLKTRFPGGMGALGEGGVGRAVRRLPLAQGCLCNLLICFLFHGVHAPRKCIASFVAGPELQLSVCFAFRPNKTVKESIN